MTAAIVPPIPIVASERNWPRVVCRFGLSLIPRVRPRIGRRIERTNPVLISAHRTSHAGTRREADDGSRTRDLRLGKPTLYQLSYVRWSRTFACLEARGYPNVNTYASTPGASNPISNVRSAMSPRFADQLVEPRFVEHAVAFAVDIDASRGARRVPVEQDAERHPRPLPRAHHQVDVACVEPERDPAVRPGSARSHAARSSSPHRAPSGSEAAHRPNRRGCGPARSPGRSPATPGCSSPPAPRRRPARSRRDRRWARFGRPPPAAAGSPARIRRTHPRRSGETGSAPRRRRCRSPASSGCRTPATPRTRCRSPPGRGRRSEVTARRTFSTSPSNGNSGVWTPTTTRP